VREKMSSCMLWGDDVTMAPSFSRLLEWDRERVSRVTIQRECERE